jgi:hypothetical protein
MPIASMLGSFASGEQWLPITIQMVASTASGLVSAFAYVTIIFAVLYHKEIKVNHYSDSIDKLPPVPKHAKVIPKRDPIKGIVTSVIFAIIFIGFPQVIFIMVEGNGVMIPVFNTDYIRSTWYLVAAFAMLGIVRECIKLMDGFYSKRLLITTIVINLLTGAISILWLSNDAIVNVDYLAAVARISAEEGLSSTGMIGGANDIFLVVILAVLILDTVVTVVKTFKND